MKSIAQLQLDWPAWRLSFSEYGELKGYDLSQTEATTDYVDHFTEERLHEMGCAYDRYQIDGGEYE